MLSLMSCGVSSSSERMELASLASRASGLRLLKSVRFGDERLDAEVTPEAMNSDLESWLLFAVVAIEEVSTSVRSLSFWRRMVFIVERVDFAANRVSSEL